MHRPAPQRISSVPETPTTTALAAPGTLAFGALLIANVALAFGPWFVRATEVGPVAAGFWRLTLAVPFLVLLAAQQGARPTRLGRGVWIGLIAGGGAAVGLLYAGNGVETYGCPASEVLSGLGATLSV